MTLTHWILLALTLVTWMSAFLWFYHGDVWRLWLGWLARRRQNRQDRAEHAAAQMRLREELAAKYLTPSPGPGPGQRA